MLTAPAPTPSAVNKVVKMIIETTEYDKDTIKTLESMLVSSYNPEHIFCDGKNWYVLKPDSLGYWTACYENPYALELIEMVLMGMKQMMIEIFHQSPSVLLADREHVATAQKNFLKWLTKFSQEATKNRIIKQAASKFPVTNFNQHHGLLFKNGQLRMGEKITHRVSPKDHLIEMIPYEFEPPVNNKTTHGVVHQILQCIFRSTHQDQSGGASVGDVFNVYGDDWNKFANFLGSILGRYVAFVKKDEVTKRINRTTFSRLLKNKKLVVVLCDDELVNINGVKTLLGNYHHLCWCFTSLISLDLDKHHIIANTSECTSKEFDLSPSQTLSQSYGYFLRTIQDE